MTEDGPTITRIEAIASYIWIVVIGFTLGILVLFLTFGPKEFLRKTI